MVNKPEDEASVNANLTFEDGIENSRSLPKRTNNASLVLDGSLIGASVVIGSRSTPRSVVVHILPRELPVDIANIGNSTPELHQHGFLELIISIIRLLGTTPLFQAPQSWLPALRQLASWGKLRQNQTLRHHQLRR